MVTQLIQLFGPISHKTIITLEQMTIDLITDVFRYSICSTLPHANTGDKDPYTQWTHCEHIVSTDNM